MQLTIESTTQLTTINGVQARVWHGVTPGGIPVRVFVHRVVARADLDCSELERELIATLPPAETVPLRRILP